MKNRQKPKQNAGAKTHQKVRASSHISTVKDAHQIETEFVQKGKLQQQPKSSMAVANNEGSNLIERKFIDLTDPKLVQNSDPNTKSPVTEENKRAQESTAARPNHTKAKITMNRHNSAKRQEELLFTRNLAKSLAGATLGRNQAEQQLQQKGFARSTATRNGLQTEDAMKKMPKQPLILAASKSLAILTMPYEASSVKEDVDIEEEPVFLSQLESGGRARVRSVQVVQPKADGGLPPLQRKLLIDVAGDMNKKQIIEQPNYVRLNANKTNSSHQMKRQQFLTTTDELVPQSFKQANLQNRTVNYFIRADETDTRLKMTENLIKFEDGTPLAALKFDKLLPVASTPKDIFRLTSKEIVNQFTAGLSDGLVVINRHFCDNIIDSSSEESTEFLKCMAETLFSLKTKQGYLLSYYQVRDDKVFDLLQPISLRSQQSTPSSEQFFSQSTVKTQQQDSLEVRLTSQGDYEIICLKKIAVKTAQEAFALMQLGDQSKLVRQTLMKAGESQGHSVFQVQRASNKGSLRIVHLSAQTNAKNDNALEQLLNCFAKAESSQNLIQKSCLTRVLKDSITGDKKKQIVVITLPLVQKTEMSAKLDQGRQDRPQLSEVMSELERLKLQNQQLQDQVKSYQQTLNKLPQNDQPTSTLSQAQSQQTAANKLAPRSALKSCFRKDAVRGTKQVSFKNQLLDNDTSLNNSILERVEHNLKYNDDTIFANLDIFKDIGEVDHKVHGKKDKFNASSLLAVKFDDLIPSEDESAEQNSDERHFFKVDESSIALQPREFDSLKIGGQSDLLNSCGENSQELADVQNEQVFQPPNQNESNKLLRSLLDECEELLFFSAKKPEVKPGDEQPFLDELSNIFQVDEAANLTQIHLNDEPRPSQNRQPDQQQSYGQQQQSTLILDEEEVGAAQINSVFDQDDIGPILGEPRMDEQPSVLPSFDASRILPALQNDLSAHEKQNFFDEESKRMLTREEARENNDSADCNLTKSDRPAIFANLCAEQKREGRIVLGGVTGKFKTPELGTEHDVTKMAEDLPTLTKQELANRPQNQEMLTQSLTNTFSTIQSLEGDLQMYAKSINKKQQPQSTQTFEYADLELPAIGRSQSLEHRDSSNPAHKRSFADVGSHSIDKGNRDIDVKAFTSDLQSYYQKIHGEIAQLKNVLADVKQRKQIAQPPIDNISTFAMFASAVSVQKNAHNEPNSFIKSQSLIGAIKQEIASQLTKKTPQQVVGEETDQSLKVIQLLEQLEGELLTSLTRIPEKADSIEVRLDKSRSNQFEEIEGSQERSPHMVKHMEIQRQLPAKSHSEVETKLFRQFDRRAAKQRLLNQDAKQSSSNVASPLKRKTKNDYGYSKQQRQFKKPSIIGQASQSVADSEMQNLLQRANEKAKPSTFRAPLPRTNFLGQPANRLCGTPQLQKKTLSDSTVNMTTTSAAFLVDQSQHSLSLILNLAPNAFDKRSHPREQRLHSSSIVRSVDSISQIGGGSFLAPPHQSNLVGASLGNLGTAFEGHKRTSTIPSNPSQNNHKMKAHSSLHKSRISASFGGRDHSNNGSALGQNIREGSDNTLTLIFDSDEEPENQALQQTVSRAKSKMLSEIVEDYFNENSNQVTSNQKHKRKLAQERIQQMRKTHSKQQSKEDRESNASPQKRGDLSLVTLPAANENEYSYHQSFMHDSSIIHLFQDPLTSEQIKPSQRNESANSRISRSSSFLKDSKVRVDSDLPYQDSSQKEHRKSANTSVDSAKARAIVSQFSSMFKKPTDPQKTTTWAPPPRIQTLKSKKQRKPLVKPSKDKIEVKEANETSRLSDIGLAEDNQELPEESKHNTSKHIMQKYLLQLFYRKPDDK